jgi:outer membrane protein OmpA-like peptidoglycan-associated protein
MKSNSAKFACLALGLVWLVTACSTVNPYTEEKQTSKLAVGAGIGAASGALIGLLTASSKDRQKNALIGAGLGALAGGGVGYYMDVQEAKLRQRLRGSGVSVTRSGNQILLNMPGNVTFASASADINASFYSVLNAVVVVLKEYAKTTVDVIGHTDNVGSAKYNQQLSERRARSVAEYLAQQGILPDRLLLAGMGETQPIASNDTPEGRSRNRRVTIQITPLTAQ